MDEIDNDRAQEPHRRDKDESSNSIGHNETFLVLH
jgi:hypothetical protein